MSMVKEAKLGVVRLYKAVKAGNVSMVQMYLLSATGDAADNVQRFDPVKVYDAWVAGGHNTEMLRVLLGHPSLAVWYSVRTRRGRYSQSESFGSAVLDKMASDVNRLVATPDPDMGKPEAMASLLLLRDFLRMVQQDKLGIAWNNLVSVFGNALIHEKTWPLALAAESKGMALRLLQFDYRKPMKNAWERGPFDLAIINDVIDWYLGMFGTLTIEDGPLAVSAVEKMYERKHWAELTKLLPDVAYREQFMNDEKLAGPLTEHVSNYKAYRTVLKIAPWIEVRE